VIRGRCLQCECPSIEVGREKGVAGLSNHSRGSDLWVQHSGSSIGPKFGRDAAPWHCFGDNRLITMLPHAIPLYFCDLVV